MARFTSCESSSTSQSCIQWMLELITVRKFCKLEAGNFLTEFSIHGSSDNNVMMECQKTKTKPSALESECGVDFNPCWGY